MVFGDNVWEFYGFVMCLGCDELGILFVYCLKCVFWFKGCVEWFMCMIVE